MKNQKIDNIKGKINKKEKNRWYAIRRSKQEAHGLHCPPEQQQAIKIRLMKS